MTTSTGFDHPNQGSDHPDSRARDTRRAVPGDAALRSRLHGMWAAVADSWGKYADYADARGAAVTARMLAVSDPQPGERVLELACGPGGVGLAAAKLVGPRGEVVLSDLVTEMTSIAAARASSAGLGNVRTRNLALEDIDEPDGGFDVVLCREGLMFAVDPLRAGQEMRRVLRPGGRVAIAVWGPREENPWLNVVFETVGAQLGMPMPPPGVPGPFSLDSRTRLAGLLVDAGFTDVAVTELSSPLRDSTFDAWWTRTSALAGPLAARLASLPADATDALRARLREVVRPVRSTSGSGLPRAHPDRIRAWLVVSRQRGRAVGRAGHRCRWPSPIRPARQRSRSSRSAARAAVCPPRRTGPPAGPRRSAPGRGRCIPRQRTSARP